MVDALAEWSVLGRRLLQACPEKFDDIIDALRETVSVHEIPLPQLWAIGVEILQHVAPKA